MRILKKRINSKGIGFLHLIPTEEDDFWHLYNLIQIGDLVKTSTYRKLVREGETGSKTSERRRIVLILKVCEINYWAEEHLLLNIKGKNCRESQYLSLGQFHTAEFEFNVPITIYKENWDQFHWNIIKEISNPHQSSDVGALVMEEGLAHLCYITQSTTLLRQKIQKNVTKKKSGNEQREKTLQDFYLTCFNAIVQEKILLNVKCLIIASPAFIKDDFLKFVKQQLLLEQYKDLAKNAAKILLAKSSSGYLHSLQEVLQDPTIQSNLSNTKALGESKVLDTFFTQLKTDSNKVAYGLKDVVYANSQNSIQTLLLSDQLARTKVVYLQLTFSKDLKKRKHYIQLMDDVKSKGGSVSVFSSLHPSGQQLNNFTGIAAVLFFAIQFDFDNDDDSDQSVDGRIFYSTYFYNKEERFQQIQQQEPQAAKLDEALMQDFDDFDSDNFM